MERSGVILAFAQRDDGVSLVYISESDGWLVGTNDQHWRHLETVARMTSIEATCA